MWRYFFAALLSMVLAVPGGQPASAQIDLPDARVIRATYSGYIAFVVGERHIDLEIVRDPLVVTSGGRPVMAGWRFNGWCCIDGEFYYNLAGASSTLERPGVALTRGILRAMRDDSLAGYLEGELLGSDILSARWRPIGGTEVPCTLHHVRDQVLTEEDGYFEADFLSFWEKFRNAIHRKDRGEVVRMTRFPFPSLACMAEEKGMPADGRLNRRKFLKFFDQLFDEKALAAIDQFDPLEIGTHIHDGGRFDPPGIPKGTVIYTFTFRPYFEVSHTFVFTKVNGVYMMVDSICVG